MTLKDIKKMVAELDFPAGIVSECTAIYTVHPEIREEKWFAAACVYMAAKRKDRPITLKEVSKVSGLSAAEIARGYRKLGVKNNDSQDERPNSRFEY